MGIFLFKLFLLILITECKKFKSTVICKNAAEYNKSHLTIEDVLYTLDNEESVLIIGPLDIFTFEYVDYPGGDPNGDLIFSDIEQGRADAAAFVRELLNVGCDVRIDEKYNLIAVNITYCY